LARVCGKFKSLDSKSRTSQEDELITGNAMETSEVQTELEGSKRRKYAEKGHTKCGRHQTGMDGVV
jgi:hypothetical protein